MLTDIEIAQQAKMLKIKDVAEKLGIDEDSLIPYGHSLCLIVCDGKALFESRKIPETLGCLEEKRLRG